MDRGANLVQINDFSCRRRSNPDGLQQSYDLWPAAGISKAHQRQRGIATHQRRGIGQHLRQGFVKVGRCRVLA
jgi:hypothetical protein